MAAFGGKKIWWSCVPLLLALAASADGRELIVSTAGELVRVDAASAERRETITSGNFARIRFGLDSDLFALDAEAGELLRFDGSTFHSRGLFLSSSYLSGAAGFTFDAANRLVVGRRTAVHVFAPGAEELERSIDLETQGVEQIGDVASGPDDLIYVSDSITGRIVRIDLGVADADPPSLFSERFGSPRGIGFEAGGALLAADSGPFPAVVRLHGDDRSLGGFFPGDLPDGHPLESVADVAVGPDGQLAVAGAELYLLKDDLSFDRAVPVASPVRSVAFAVQPPAAGIEYSAWRAEHFTADEQEDPAVSDPMADPERDGVVNLVRYALGAARGEPVAELLPQARLEERDGAAFWFYSYIQSREAADAAVELEVSSDMAAWERAPGRLELVEVENLGEHERLTYLDTVPADDLDRTFARLHVTDTR